jgi:uncharacterized membrane protein
MPQITLSHPWYLLLLPLLAAGAVYVSRRSLADLRGARAKWSLGLRIAILACAVLALAGLQISRPTKKLALLFVLDRSDSIPPEQKRLSLDYINEAARKMGPNDEGGVLVFGGDAYLELEPKSQLSLKQIHSQVPEDYTNLAGSIRLALAAFPEDAQKRVVVLSDGNENLGSAVEEAASASSAQVQIDAVPIAYHYGHEALLEKMVVPSEVKVGEPFEVRIIARSTEAAPAVIRLLRSGELIAQQSVELLQGPNVINFQQSLDKASFYTYEAIIETPADELPDNNRALGFVLVKGKPKVLIVENNLSDARFLESALSGQQLDVDVRQPGRLPATLAEFQTYDSIVLSNVGAYQLTVEQMKAIRSSVRDLGTGLVMLGGENSFGPGAYRGTPIEEALPVEMEVKKHKVMPVGAVALVLHTCEFPDGNRWARETAAAVVDVLGARDKFGVLLYDASERWGIPMQPASNKERIKSELYNLEPGDMPDFHAIMKLAYQGLMTDAKEAAVKHIIVISDGDPVAPSPELLNNIAKSRITISTVGIGIHGSNCLPMLAQVTKGEYYPIKSPSEIPRIFLKEAQRVLKPAIIEETFRPIRHPGSQVMTGIDQVPPLMGYVAVTAKEQPGVEVALVSKHDDPILASWRFGLGKAVAFTSDAKNRWASPWVADPSHFAKFWAQTIRWTVRTSSRANLDTQVEIKQRKGKVVVDVVDAKGNFVNMLDIRGSVAGEQVSPKLRIDQTAPGRYEGEFDAPDKGQYMVALSYTDEKGAPRTHRVGAAVPYSPEYKDLSANSAVLTSLADKTGGRVYPALSPKMHEQDLARVWRHDRRTHSAPQDLWPLLVLLGALLLPADIGVRRLNVSREELMALLATLSAATFGRFSGSRRGSEQREEGMGRLLKAKMSARGGADVAPEPVSEPAPPASATASAPDTRPRYEGPARTMPTVAGAPSVTPTPAAPATARPATERSELEMTASPAPPKPAEPAKLEAPPAPEKPQPTKPSTPAAQPQVVWHKPVPGVTNPTPPPAKPVEAAKPAEKPAEQPAASDEPGSTSRLLRAKRRAQDKKDEP